MSPPSGAGGSGAAGQSSAAGTGSGAAAGAGGAAGTASAGVGGGAGSAGSAGSAGAGAPAAGSGVEASFETVKFVIDNAPCFGAGCHNDEQNPLDLQVDDGLHARLTSRISMDCGGIPVVNPGNPDQSALVMLLKGPCSETPRMPIGCVDDQDAMCVPADYIAAIEAWIAAGAPPE